MYGDIGTSPLYVFNNIFVELGVHSGNPSKADVLGATSLVIWTIVLIVFIKYACIVMFADDNGEGEGLRSPVTSLSLCHAEYTLPSTLDFMGAGHTARLANFPTLCKRLIHAILREFVAHL